MLLSRASLSQGQRLQPSPSIQRVSPTHEGTFYLLGQSGNSNSCWTSLVDHPKNAKNEHTSMDQEDEIGLPEQETAEAASRFRKMPAERTESGFIEQFRRDPKRA